MCVSMLVVLISIFTKADIIADDDNINSHIEYF